MQVTNPATEDVQTIDDTPLDQLPDIVARARAAQPAWGDQSVADRAKVLGKLANLIESNADSIANYITQDMGKPIKISRQEANVAISNLKFACDHAAEWLAADEVEGGYVQYDPLGVVAVISPWNGPFVVPIIAITPALLAGNAVVFKPSENALRSGIEVGKLFHALDGLPKDLVQTVIGGKDHGRQLVAQDVNMVSFTGSGVAGKDIMKRCSDKLARVLLELGGLDAAIVLKDADIQATAQSLVRNNCANTGQICCAVKRIYVEQEVYDDLVKACAAESEKVSYGDPHEDHDMGPLVAKFQLDKVESTVEDARAKGAQVLTGGQRADRPGYFYPSTVITKVNHDMKIMNDEPFGPLLPICPVENWEEAVRLANDTRYGLTGSVWTRDQELGKKIMSRLEVGVAALNSHGVGPIGTPFGGAKESGIGRIKTKEGMRAFTNVKMMRVGG